MTRITSQVDSAAIIAALMGDQSPLARAVLAAIEPSHCADRFAPTWDPGGLQVQIDAGWAYTRKTERSARPIELEDLRTLRRDGRLSRGDHISVVVSVLTGQDDIDTTVGNAAALPDSEIALIGKSPEEPLVMAVEVRTSSPIGQLVTGILADQLEKGLTEESLEIERQISVQQQRLHAIRSQLGTD